MKNSFLIKKINGDFLRETVGTIHSPFTVPFSVGRGERESSRTGANNMRRRGQKELKYKGGNSGRNVLSAHSYGFVVCGWVAPPPRRGFFDIDYSAALITTQDFLFSAWLSRTDDGTVHVFFLYVVRNQVAENFRYSPKIGGLCKISHILTVSQGMGGKNLVVPYYATCSRLSISRTNNWQSCYRLQHYIEF